MSEESPSRELDKAVKDLLKDATAAGVDELKFERQRKAVMAAVSWFKVKHGIMSKDDDFDPDGI